MSGKVYLVGAGPGDPELLTRKGERLLRCADAVLYDALANPALLALAPPHAERLPVGKRAGDHSATQRAIERALIARARRGLTVVRLKGGDPMIFGRGGEEVTALERAGVAWEVVPGVSAGTGVPAAHGIALTRRGVAACVRFATGHAPVPGAAPDRETLVLFMAAAHVAARARELLAAGWPPSTPAAIIERGTLPGARCLRGRLDRIGARARRARVKSPALLLVGAVAGPVPGPPPAPRPGLILVAHGSPLASGQSGITRLARALAAPGQFTRAAFLPPARPSLATAVAAAARRGVRRLVIVPYFLVPGLHVSRDLPALAAAVRRRHPRVRIALAACLEGHTGLLAAVRARAAEAASEL